jgi:predicted nucleic acid-binding protein
MIRVVLDTNVVISALLNPKGVRDMKVERGRFSFFVARTRA